MNNRVKELLNKKITVEVAEELSTHLDKDKYESIVIDIPTIKGMIYSAQTLAALGVSKYIKATGWDGIINGAELNEQMRGLLSNPAIVIYTQLLVAIILALAEPEPAPDSHP